MTYRVLSSATVTIRIAASFRHDCSAKRKRPRSFDASISNVTTHPIGDFAIDASRARAMHAASTRRRVSAVNAVTFIALDRRDAQRRLSRRANHNARIPENPIPAQTPIIVFPSSRREWPSQSGPPYQSVRPSAAVADLRLHRFPNFPVLNICRRTCKCGEPAQGLGGELRSWSTKRPEEGQREGRLIQTDPRRLTQRNGRANA